MQMKKVPTCEHQDFAVLHITKLSAFPSKWFLKPGIFWSRDQYFSKKNNSQERKLCLVTSPSVICIWNHLMGDRVCLTTHKFLRAAAVPSTVPDKHVEPNQCLFNLNELYKTSVYFRTSVTEHTQTIMFSF